MNLKTRLRLSEFNFQMLLSVYVENGRSKDDTTLTFNQQGASSTWNIKIMQIECESAMRYVQ